MPRRTTAREDRELKDVLVENMIGGNADWVLEWISENFKPEDIFDEDILIKWVGLNCEVGDVFKEDVLKAWAEGSGYSKE